MDEAVPGGHKARIRYPNGKTRSKTFPTIREARAWQRRTLTEINDAERDPGVQGGTPYCCSVDALDYGRLM